MNSNNLRQTDLRRKDMHHEFPNNQISLILYITAIAIYFHHTFKNHKLLHHMKLKHIYHHKHPHYTSLQSYPLLKQPHKHLLPHPKLLQKIIVFPESNPTPTMSEIKRSSQRSERTKPTPDELSEHLEEALGISNFEEGPKLVGAVIAQKLPNKGEIKSILKVAWKDYGEAKIVWVRENLFSITVTDEEMASKIIDNGPWFVMKCCFSVKRWPPILAIEEVEVDIVPHWIQIREIPLNLCHEENVIKLGHKAGDVIEFEDAGKQRGFLRIRIGVDTNLPLLAGFWLPRANDTETWVEYQYKRLADFCYRCGRIGHSMNACTFEVPSGVRRRAATVRQRHGEGGEERGPHAASEEVGTRSLMSQRQPGIRDLTSRELERSQTLESRHSRNTPLSFCQVPESRQT